MKTLSLVPRAGCALALLAFALLLAACEDPSDAGLVLVGEEGGAPETRVLPLRNAVSVQDDTLRSVTGNADRLLAGNVQDDLVGRISTTGYLDVGLTDTDQRGDAAAVSAAVLELSRDYVYGDTLAPVTLTLRDMPEEWTPTDQFTADTTLNTGAAITQFTFAPTDTLVSVELPPAWVQANTSTLLDTDTSFANAFHGFALEGTAGNATPGFTAAGSALLVVTGEDTTRFGTTKTFTHVGVDRTQATDPRGEERLLLQNGTGLAVRFTLRRDSLLALLKAPTASINRALLRFTADLDLSESAGSFARPAPQTVRLYGADEGQSSFAPIAEFTLSDGQLELNDTDAEVLRRLIQNGIRGSSVPNLYRLQIPGGNTLDALFFYNADASAERAPQLSLTYTSEN